MVVLNEKSNSCCLLKMIAMLQVANRCFHRLLLILLVIFKIMACQCASADDPNDMSREGRLWEPYVSWSIHVPEYAGNPFDIKSSVQFLHDETGEERNTEMFYIGNNSWEFRFAGTQVGLWSFETTSDIESLHGLTGNINIKPNPDPDIRGFLTYQGNQYARMNTNTSDLEGYLFTVFMDRNKHESYLDKMSIDLEVLTRETLAFLDTARQNGCEVLFLHVNNNWFQFGERQHNTHNQTTPDLQTFQMIETIITTVHKAGGRVHIWKWGDEQRHWTPLGLPGGANGETDQRLQRYIAARLGPLPGWSMGYGFDLHEWTDEKQVTAWASYLQAHMGWPHLLSARGYPIQTAHTINSYDGYDRRRTPLRTSNAGPESYYEIDAHMKNDLAKPHIYEERHTFNRTGHDNLDMDGIRRLLWWTAMAGGMGSFIGFYPADSSAFGGHPYPAEVQLRTYHTFWREHKRFVLGMALANSLSPGGAWILKDAEDISYVLYQEDTATIEVDLTHLASPLPAVAVNTKMAYEEIPLGEVQPGLQTLRFPVSSDWAVAIGVF